MRPRELRRRRTCSPLAISTWRRSRVGMRVLKEGDTGRAICYTCERSVPIHYEYRTVRLEKTNVDVPNVLVGVCDGCDGTVTIPAQSTPRLKEVRAAKEEVLQAHLPRHLDDVLRLIAHRLEAPEETFAPAMLRFYLREVATRPRFAGRVARLAVSELARGGGTTRRSLRLSRDLLEAAWQGARAAGIRTKTDLVRGVVVAAKEDVLESSSASARRRAVEGIAAGA